MNWLQVNRVSVKDCALPQSKLKRNLSLQTRNQAYNSLKAKMKIKSNPSFSPEKNTSLNLQQNQLTLPKLTKSVQMRLPQLQKNKKSNTEFQKQQTKEIKRNIFYQSLINSALKSFENKYMLNQARVHFNQTIEILRMTRNFKLLKPKININLQKKSKFKKTIYLDLDQTLIHTDETSNNYTIKLKFPIQSGDYIEAGVRIRPFCKEFLVEVSQMAQIIIFTASSSSYADVILDHLDPNNQYFSHRLYREHCTLEGGVYLKDLRCINRKLEDVVIVDNSAFSYVLQKQNGIPIIPFYHYKEDNQLESLILFLKQVIALEDCRDLVKKTFFWEQYLKQNKNINYKKIFHRNYKLLINQN